MAGRIPKPAAQRRRRNATGGRKVELGAQKVSIPPLPGDRDWHPRTVECWRVVWSSDVAGIWIDVDRLALERWAALLDLVHTGADKTFTHQEIRMLEDRFGLSPLARRRLQWEIDQAAGEKKPDASVDAAQDDRFLRVVGGTDAKPRRRRKAVSG